jgi:glutathione peroxidase-family protein
LRNSTKTKLILFAESLQIGEDSFKFNEIKFQLITKQDSKKPIFEMLKKKFDENEDVVWGYLKFVKNRDGRQFILFFNQLEQKFMKKYRDKIMNLDLMIVFNEAQLNFQEGIF